MTSTPSVPLVIPLEDADVERLALVGGKAANLGALSRVEGVAVPRGFCLTTRAYDRVVGSTPAIAAAIDGLARVDPRDRDAIEVASAEVRRAFEGAAVPEDVASAVAAAVDALGGGTYAVRSSATTEDLPTASFAGQHDSYLHVEGTNAVLAHVRRCWGSLFTERAVSYRARNGVDGRSAQMAVIVQQMVDAKCSGVMFTADPISSDRTVVVIEACPGLGEALVAGEVAPDVFRVRRGELVERTIVTKAAMVVAAPGGGTRRRPIEGEAQHRATLTDAQAIELAALGRRIEACLAVPQDIEWCRAGPGGDGIEGPAGARGGDRFVVVQSRPITTLFPVPEAPDGTNRAYVSVGHGQMMTDAMAPLGLSFWQMTTPAPMAEAGSRLFVDVTARLSSPSSRADLLDVFGKQDPLLRDALQQVLDRDGFIALGSDDPGSPPPRQAGMAPAQLLDPAPGIVEALIAETEASVARCASELEGLSGDDALQFIMEDLQELRRRLHDPRGYQVFMTAIEASRWLNDQLLEWLGVRNAADALTQSVPHNVTSEMGLALLDVADAIRPHLAAVEVLRRVGADATADVLALLDGVEGGNEARVAIEGFLERYGMRCVGEIDIARTRWQEDPSAIVPMVLGHVEHLQPGEAQRRWERGRQEAAAAEEDLLDRLGALPDGAEKAAAAKLMIDRVRTFMGYREYPKYGMVCRYSLYRRAIMAEADRLVAAGTLGTRDDVLFLRFEELRDVVRTGKVDQDLIASRRAELRAHQQLQPPRVLTSDGEAVVGSYRRDDLPEGALAGLAVSAGTVEGRARVLQDVTDAELEPGDILVTTSTDPSWTPVFVGIAGLVTEVGGRMTHGAVIAREYGLPAVVGVEGATHRIADGQWLRVHGTEGYVEVIDAP